MDTTQSRIAEVGLPTQVQPLQDCPALHSFEWENAPSETTQRPEFVKTEVSHEVPATDSLLGHNQEIVRILTALGIPRPNQSEILQKIESISLQPFRYATMEVRILAVTYEEHGLDDYDIARAERESMEQEVKPIPATQSSIDALERLVFDDNLGSSMDCTVCMEEITAGVEAIRMPCSHVYHSNCIVQWLQRSHLCPLCRYHMPCDL